MRNLWMGMRGLFYGGQERGQTLVEYALILALVAILIAGALSVLGSGLSDIYNNITGAIP